MTADLHGRTQRRAHEIWEQEGRPEGRASEHWARAEAEILAEAGDPKPGGGKPSRAGSASRGTRARKRRGAGAPTEGSPSDLAADEAAKGGGGTGP